VGNTVDPFFCPFVLLEIKAAQHPDIAIDAKACIVKA
jgi:hypothetical protein